MADLREAFGRLIGGVWGGGCPPVCLLLCLFIFLCLLVLLCFVSSMPKGCLDQALTLMNLPKVALELPCLNLGVRDED
jgi:hypothetical protein